MNLAPKGKSYYNLLTHTGIAAVFIFRSILNLCTSKIIYHTSLLNYICAGF